MTCLAKNTNYFGFDWNQVPVKALPRLCSAPVSSHLTQLSEGGPLPRELRCKPRANQIHNLQKFTGSLPSLLGHRRESTSQKLVQYSKNERFHGFRQSEFGESPWN